MDRSAHRAAQRAGKFKDGNFLDNATAPTPTDRLRYALKSQYWGGYPDIDALWDQHEKSLNPAERMNLIMRIQKLLYDKRVFTYTQQLNSPAAIGPRVKGNPWLVQNPYPVWIFCPHEDLELNE